MFLWRISGHADLAGVGAELRGGRWHTASAGKRIVYLSEHPAVALVETLANLRGDQSLFPDTFQLMKVFSPDTHAVGELTADDLAAVSAESSDRTRLIGDEWLAKQTSSLLRVPSIPSPESFNFLLNPLHPGAASLTLEWARRFPYDTRLFHVAKARPNA